MVSTQPSERESRRGKGRCIVRGGCSPDPLIGRASGPAFHSEARLVKDSEQTLPGILMCPGVPTGSLSVGNSAAWISQ